MHPNSPSLRHPTKCTALHYANKHVSLDLALLERILDLTTSIKSLSLGVSVSVIRQSSPAALLSIAELKVLSGIERFRKPDQPQGFLQLLAMFSSIGKLAIRDLSFLKTAKNIKPLIKENTQWNVHELEVEFGSDLPQLFSSFLGTLDLIPNLSVVSFNCYNTRGFQYAGNYLAQ